MAVKLIIADHQAVMRAGLRKLLGESIAVASEAASEKSLINLIKEKRGNVVILDVHFALGDGFATLTKIRKRWPDLPILMWSVEENPTYVARSIALGATGYLAKDIRRRELHHLLEKAVTGAATWTKAQRSEFIDPKPPPADSPLTPREFDVLRQLAFGLSNKEIGLALGISYETVKEHMQHILRKLEVPDRTAAAVEAIRKGWVL